MKGFGLFAIGILLATAMPARAGIRAESTELVSVTARLNAYAQAEAGDSRAARNYKRAVANLQDASIRIDHAVASNASPSHLAQALKNASAIHYEVIAISGDVVFTKPGYKALLRYEDQLRKVAEKFTYYAVTLPFEGYR